MKRTIRWKRDFSGREVEALCDGKPLPALPPSEQGELSCLIQDWSSQKGSLTFVEVLDGSDHRPYVFIDIANGRTISGIPRDAFEFVD